MKIGDLFLSLGIDADMGAIAAAESALARVKHQAEAAAAATELLNAAFHDVGKATDLIGLDFDAALEHQQKRVAARAKRIRAGLGAAFKGLGIAAVVGFGITRAVQGISRLSDSYNSAASRVRMLTDDTEKQAAINQKLYASAQETGSAFSDVAQLYQQVGKAAVDNGKSLEEGVQIVDTINKALKASGATGDAASAALTQLAQGLGSGTLRGEEFNSVIEQAPFLIDILAKDLGKTRGEMRKMANAGQLTAKVVLGALERQKGAVDEAFGKRIPLISEGFARMRNEIEKTFGELMQDKEVANAFAVAMKGVSAAIIGVIKGFAAMVVFFVKHKRVFVAAVTAMTAALAYLGATAAITWLAVAGPIALVIGAIVLLGLYIEDIAAAMFAGFMKAGEGVDWFLSKLATIPRVVRRGFHAVGDFFRAIGREIKATFESVLNWITNKINWVVDRVNWAIRQLNRLPGVDISTVGHVGGGAPTAGGTAVPFTPITRSSSAAPVNVNATATINVHPPAGANPNEVAGQTREQFEAFLGEHLRTAADAIGE